MILVTLIMIDCITKFRFSALIPLSSILRSVFDLQPKLINNYSYVVVFSPSRAVNAEIKRCLAIAPRANNGRIHH
jgi:hypothetical protein